MKLRKIKINCGECGSSGLFLSNSEYMPLKGNPLFTVKEVFCAECGVVHNEDIGLDEFIYGHIIQNEESVREGRHNKFHYMDIFCPHCNCRELERRQFVYTKSKVKIKYYCKICKKEFVERGIDFNKTHLPSIISFVRKLYESENIVQEEIAKIASDEFKIKIHQSHVRRWCKDLISKRDTYKRKILENRKNILSENVGEIFSPQKFKEIMGYRYNQTTNATLPYKMGWIEILSRHEIKIIGCQ